MDLPKSYEVAVFTEPSKLTVEQQRNIVVDLLHGYSNEELLPLVKSIDQELDTKGLNQPHDDLGIKRFLVLKKEYLERIKQGKPVGTTDGFFNLHYDTKVKDSAIEASIEAGFGAWGLTAKSYYKRGLLNNTSQVVLGSTPIDKKYQLENYLLRSSVTNNVDDKIWSGLGIRIHECAHRYNSEDTEPLVGGQRNTLFADIFREAHSCLVLQACNLNYEDSTFVDSFKNRAHAFREVNQETIDKYFQEVGTHKEAVLSKESSQMAKYAINVIWQLRALGYKEREVGQTIARFQKKSMLDWNNDDLSCSKIEKWLQEQWDYKGIIWKKSSAIHPLSVESEVQKTRDRFKRESQEVSDITLDKSKEFLSTQNQPIILFGEPTLNDSSLRKINFHFPPGILIGKGEILKATFVSPRAGWNGSCNLYILDLQKGTSRKIPY